MRTRPESVTIVSQVLGVDAFFFLVAALVMYLFGSCPNAATIEGALVLLFLGIGMLYGILAYSFFKLRKWAYIPVKYLVRIDALSAFLNLEKKVTQPEVLQLFGLEKSPQKDESHVSRNS